MAGPVASNLQFPSNPAVQAAWPKKHLNRAHVRLLTEDTATSASQLGRAIDEILLAAGALDTREHQETCASLLVALSRVAGVREHLQSALPK